MTDLKPTCGDAGGRKVTDGTPCAQTLNLSPSNGQCIVHDAERTDQHRAMSQRGQAASTVSKRDAKYADPEDVPPVPETLEDAVEWAGWALRATACGRIEHRVGATISTLINSFKSALEKRDLLREIAKPSGLR